MKRDWPAHETRLTTTDNSRMAAIRQLFEKFKTKQKFKNAGEGHKLTEDTRKTTTGSGRAQGQVAAPRKPPTESMQMAAQAALQRQTSKEQPGTLSDVLFLRKYVYYYNWSYEVRGKMFCWKKKRKFGRWI